MLDKAYMIDKIDERLAQIKQEYNLAVQGKSKACKFITEQSAAQVRHRLNRDKATLILLRELLSHYRLSTLENDEAEKAFDLLTEPNNRHSKNNRS